MAKQPKVNAPTPVKPATPPVEGAKQTKSPGIPPKGTGDTDVFERVLGADGKGVIPTAGTPPVAVKLAPQAQLIVNVIEAQGASGVTRKALVDLLVPNGLVTRQPPGRILSYYQKPIVDAGFITVTRPAA